MLEITRVVVRQILALALSCLVVLAGISAVAKNTGGNANEVRDLLLRPAGWIHDWKPGPTSRVDPDQFGETGNGELIFEARGDAIVLIVHNLTWSMTCRRDVTLSGDTVRFDACLERNVMLRFDANDHDFPFKGGNPCMNIGQRPGRIQETAQMKNRLVDIMERR